MNELQIFSSPKFGQVRTVEINGKIHFVALDIAKSLGYKDPNSAITRHTKGSVKYPVLTTGGEQLMNVIPKGDIYRLAANSELPGADEFESWIFDEVLVSIDQHGMYAKDELLDNPDLMIKVLQELKKEREEKKLLQTENNLLSQQTLTWTSRKVLEAIVKAYGASIHLPDVNGFQEAWRDFKPYGTIYKITNNSNGKVYIGQTIQGFSKRYCYAGAPMERVYKCHVGHKKCGGNYNSHLIRSIDKNGLKNFIVDTVFDVAFSKEELDWKEDYYIKLFNSANSCFGYNKKGGGAKGKPNDETRAKMSASLKGHPNYLASQTEETKMKISEAMKGRILSESTKRKISTARTGMKFSVEHKARLSGVRNNPEHNSSKKVVCLNTGEIFDSQTEASRIYKSQKVGDCCRGTRRSAGNINGERLAWLFYTDYLNATPDEINGIIKYANQTKNYGHDT
jgi:group I intron endonuclease